MAYLFSAASSQYLTLPSLGTFADGNLTLSAWYYPTNNTGVQSIFGFSNGTSQGVLLYTNVGKLEANRFNSPTFNTSTSVANLNVGQWNHVALVVNTAGSSQRVWLNGVASSSVSPTASPANSQFFIGTRRYLGSLADYANGRIAEAGVWNAALPDDQIISLSKRFRCRYVRGINQILDLRLIRQLQDLSSGGTISPANNPTVFDHPPIIYP